MHGPRLQQARMDGWDSEYEGGGPSSAQGFCSVNLLLEACDLVTDTICLGVMGSLSQALALLPRPCECEMLALEPTLATVLFMHYLHVCPGNRS